MIFRRVQGARGEGGGGAVEVGGGAQRKGGCEKMAEEREEGAQDHMQRRSLLLTGRGREGTSKFNSYPFMYPTVYIHYIYIIHIHYTLKLYF